MVAAIDRIGRRWMNTMQTIAYLSHRGVKIRSLSASERIWASYLEADPDTPEALIGHMLTIFISWCAQQEALSISQRTKAGLARARQNGKVIGRPTRMTDDQIEAARWFRSAGISIRGIDGGWGCHSPLSIERWPAAAVPRARAPERTVKKCGLPSSGL